MGEDTMEHITNVEFDNLIENGRTEEVFEYLFLNYKKFIRTCVSKYVYASRLDIEDLESIAYQEFWNAFLLFDPHNAKDCSFATFFTMFINRKMVKVVNKERTLDRRGVRQISLDIKIKDSVSGDLSLVDVVEDKRLENDLYNTETRFLIEKIMPLLTKEQATVFGLYWKGYKESEIARKTNSSRQTVNRRINAVRKKAKDAGIFEWYQAI